MLREKPTARAPNEVRRHYRDLLRETETPVDEDKEEEPRTWRDDLMDILLEMTPNAFERLTQRLLRESGFTQVDVTGRSGDGGIDGKGILKLGGLINFHVMFQYKRFRGSITPSDVRDFRGAMVGRADKGLLITTGKFTQAAINEAKRDGAPTIDLIDGETLMDKLKELELGVKTEIEHIERARARFEYSRVQRNGLTFLNFRHYSLIYEKTRRMN